MSVYDDIRSTFEVTLNNITGLPDIAWENTSFTPTTDQSYIKVRMIPVTREPAVRGLNPQMYYRGYFLLECCTPEGVGPASADTLANTIISNIDAPEDITQSGFSLTIEYSERDLGTQEGSHYCVPVRIGWFTYNSQ